MHEPATTPTAFAEFYAASLRESAEVALATIEACQEQTAEAARTIIDTYRNGGKVLFCGNGGSAADCQHLATELMIRLSHDISRPALGAISICTDPSNMTAGGNDIGFDNVFARNVEGLGERVTCWWASQRADAQRTSGGRFRPPGISVCARSACWADPAGT